MGNEYLCLGECTYHKEQVAGGSMMYYVGGLANWQM